MISAVILTKNSQQHIEECLKSLKDFDEVIVYDNGSTDLTLSIAGKFKNVKIVEGEFLGFGKSRNEAAKYAKNDWILAIDSDEVLTDFNPPPLNEDTVYAIKRENLFYGKVVRYAGWGDDWIKRLYNRKFHSFKEVEVHESIEAKKWQKMEAVLRHYAIDDVTQFLLKSAKYAKMERKDQKKLNPFAAFLRASFAFFKSYVIKLGFLEGYRGLVIGVGNFNGVFFKYVYRYFDDLSHKSG